MEGCVRPLFTVESSKARPKGANIFGKKGMGDAEEWAGAREKNAFEI